MKLMKLLNGTTIIYVNPSHVTHFFATGSSTKVLLTGSNDEGKQRFVAVTMSGEQIAEEFEKALSE